MQLSLPHQGDCKTNNVQQNVEQIRTPTMGVAINNKSTTAEPSPKNGQQPKPPGGGGGGLNAFYWYKIFALDSSLVKIDT